MSLFNATGTGPTGALQKYTVPADGDYRIIAAGAEGGFMSGNNNPNGLGARIEGTVSLKAGDVVRILVGQEGGISGSTGGGQAGGGGTFVVLGNPDTEDESGFSYTEAPTPLIVAGGGAGSPDSSSSQNPHGRADNRGGDFVAVGMSNNSGAGGGGSFLVNGGGDSGQRGFAFVNGGKGNGSWAEGGFGGGGGKGGSYNDGAGGGGYDGGDHSYEDREGGGGSFNAGTDQENFGGETDQGNLEDGWVSIELLLESVEISGQATDADGNPVDTVFFHIWGTKELRDSVEPDGFGNWTVEIPEGVYSISYFKDGYQPITHGPYTVEPEDEETT